MSHINRYSNGSLLRREGWRAYSPLLAILALVLASMACIGTELRITVIHNEETEDSLLMVFRQYLSPSYVEAAKKANEKRAKDFDAAKRPLTDPPLPESMADMKELFNIQKYQDMGYEIEESTYGFAATELVELVQKQEAEDWIVEKIHDPKQPELVTYRVKVYLDLTDLEGLEIFELRNEELGDPPDLSPSAGGTEMSGSPLGDMFSMIGSAADAGEQEMEIELYYAHMALRDSEPFEYKVVIMLPGKMSLHELDGKEAGTLDKLLNEVTLVLDEATIIANTGKKMVFEVESVLKDCRYACQGDHIVWDGNEESTTCDCACEKGMFSLDDTKGMNPKDIECHDCNILCTNPERDLVIDLENCEPGVCACKCKPPLVSSWDGLKCITEEESWLETNLISKNGPSLEQIKVAIEAILDPDNQKDVNLMTGWKFLTSRKRELLVQRLESLGNAVDRTQLTVYVVSEMTTDRLNELIIRKENRVKDVRNNMIDKVKYEIEKRRRIHKVIIDEIGGDSKFGPQVLKIPEYISMIFKTPKEIATKLVEEELTNTVKGRLEEEVMGENPPTIEAAAMVLIKNLPYWATKDCLADYYRYKNYYNQFCPETCNEAQAQQAHQKALEELLKHMEEGEEDEVNKEDFYTLGRLGWAEEGEAYDRAFWRLNRAGID